MWIPFRHLFHETNFLFFRAVLFAYWVAMPKRAKPDQSCSKIQCTLDNIDLPQLCLKEKPQRKTLCAGAIKLPKVCECLEPCEFIQRPRILASTKFLQPCPKTVKVHVPRVYPQPNECVQVPRPTIELKSCPTSVRHKKVDVPIDKPCPKVKPVKVCTDKCRLQLPKIAVEDINCPVKLETGPFQMPCPEVKCKDMDIVIPVIREKHEPICVEAPKFCRQPAEDCPIQKVPCWTETSHYLLIPRRDSCAYI